VLCTGPAGTARGHLRPQGYRLIGIERVAQVSRLPRGLRIYLKAATEMRLAEKVYLFSLDR